MAVRDGAERFVLDGVEGEKKNKSLLSICVMLNKLKNGDEREFS